jgi:hypothetical protein
MQILPTFPPGFTPRARVLIYKNTTNIGDAIQTVAITRLLGGACAGVYRDSPMPGLYSEVPFVVNGWLGRGRPGSGGNCIFAGVHLGHREADYVRWIRESGNAVGARDQYTKGLLASNRISSEMIGCTTLTLPRYSGPRRGRYSIDVNPVPGTEYLSSTIPDLAWADEWELALHRLDQLRKAEIVYTRRLHVVLPCLAFGTPVVFPSNEFRDLFDKSRLSLLHDIGFAYGEVVEMDVTPLADLYVRFLENAVNSPIRPVDHPSMPIPIMLPGSGQPDLPEPAVEATPAKPSPDVPLQIHCKAAPSVSALVMTKDGATRLPACLESIRRTAFVKNIVVCVDNRTTDESLNVARSFTPYVHLVPGGYPEMLMSRLMPLCPGDYILRLDDDEQLGGNWEKQYFDLLVRFNEITHFWLPRRWAVPPGDHFIATRPWFPDLQMCLFLNDPSLISCPARVHEHLKVKGRSLVLWDRWIEHFNLVLSSRADREAKCRRYLELRPEYDLSRYYLFEDEILPVRPMTTSPTLVAEELSQVANRFRSFMVYEPDSELSFRAGGNGSSYALGDWSTPEPWGTWTLNEEVAICLPMEQSIGREATLVVVVLPFLCPQHPVSRVQALYFGELVADWIFEAPGWVEKRIALSADLISNDKCPVFTFRVVNPASPSEVDLSGDSRRLGIGFASLRLVCGPTG